MHLILEFKEVTNWFLNLFIFFKNLVESYLGDDSFQWELNALEFYYVFFFFFKKNNYGSESFYHRFDDPPLLEFHICPQLLTFCYIVFMEPIWW
jgi:hypothetical protein